MFKLESVIHGNSNKSDKMKQVRLLAGLFIVAIVLIASGCMNDKEPTAPVIDASNAFASLNFTTNVAYVQQGDTLPLSLIATAIDGSTIPINTDSIHWVSADSSLVHVDTLGRIIGRGLTQLPVEVVARYTHAFTTRTDTINVYVTLDGFRATQVKITVLDSTRVGADADANSPRLRVDLIDDNGEVRNPDALPIFKPESIFLTYSPIGGPLGEPVYFVKSIGTYFGRFWIKASFNLYGVEVRDSVEFTGLHRYKLVTITAIEAPDGTISASGMDSTGRITVQSCGRVGFLLVLSRPVDVVFSDSLAPSDGCDPLSESALSDISYYGEVYKGDSIGGNLLNLQPVGYSFYYRRSNTKGQISWYIRDAITKEPLSIGGKFQVIDVD